MVQHYPPHQIAYMPKANGMCTHDKISLFIYALGLLLYDVMLYLISDSSRKRNKKKFVSICATSALD